jgi:hypothetical protein
LVGLSLRWGVLLVGPVTVLGEVVAVLGLEVALVVAADAEALRRRDSNAPATRVA